MGSNASCQSTCCVACTYKCCNKEVVVEEGFRDVLGLEFFRSIPDLQATTHVAIVLVKSLDVKAARQNGYLGDANFYVEMELKDANDLSRTRPHQKQKTSCVFDTLTPSWRPPEKLQFVFYNYEETDIVVYVKSLENIIHKYHVLGEGLLKLKEFSMGDNNIKHDFRILHSESGRDIGHIEVELSIVSVKEALSQDVHEVYEYERFLIGKGWSHENKLPSDPGRFSRVDGKKYHDNLGAVEPDIPENFQANDWKHYATDYDPEGWFYANSYRSQTWDKDQGTNHVRRRVLTRFIFNPDYNFYNDSARRKSLYESYGIVQDDTNSPMTTNPQVISFHREH